jgi:two-component system response regulator BasR
LLFVEDDPAIVRSIVPALRACGHLVEISSTCAEGIAALDAGNWTVVILDLGLPDHPGAALVAHARKRSNLVPILITSASGATAVERALELGANGSLPKPYRVAQLLEACEALSQ